MTGAALFPREKLRIVWDDQYLSCEMKDDPAPHLQLKIEELVYSAFARLNPDQAKLVHSSIGSPDTLSSDDTIIKVLSDSSLARLAHAER